MTYEGELPLFPGYEPTGSFTDMNGEGNGKDLLEVIERERRHLGQEVLFTLNVSAE